MGSAARDFKNDFTSRDVRAFWDGVSEIYDKANDQVRGAHDQRYHESFKYFVDKLPLRILNVWSRTGEGVEFLRATGVSCEIINLEVSLRMIRKGLSYGRKGKYVQTDLTHLPVKTGSFDLVWSLETLEHCPDPELFLREVHRALTDDGCLVMSCPPAFAEIVLRLYEIFAFNHGEGPHRFIASWNVKTLLRRCGFTLLEHKGTLFFPFKNSLLKKVDAAVEVPLNKLGLSDLGIRQFYFAQKIA